jgi:hypothetical protein
MKLHKTRSDERETYKYYDANGKLVIELKPGENDVTEADIRTLHLLDDKEVRSNLKYRHGDLKEQKAWLRNGSRITLNGLRKGITACRKITRSSLP